MSNDEKENIELIKKLDEKTDTLSDILQKFGLEMITSFGKNTHNLKILIDKMDKFYSTLIDIKGLIPLLNRIIESQNVLESEIDLIKSLIQRNNITIKEENVEKGATTKNKLIAEKKDLIIGKFSDLIKKIEKSTDTKTTIKELEDFKRNFFELTGGHKILYEISRTITELENAESFSKEIKENLTKKINIWMDKL